MAEVAADQLPQLCDVVAQRFADLLDESRAKLDLGRGRAVPFEQGLSSGHDLARKERGFLVRGRGNPFAKLLAGQDGPGHGRALQEPLKPAEAIAVARPVGARPVERGKRKAEEVQHALIGFRRIGLEIVEYDHVATLVADDIEEAADMFAEARYLIVDQLPRLHAGTRDLPASAAVLDQPPGRFEIAGRFVALVAKALM